MVEQNKPLTGVDIFDNLEEELDLYKCLHNGKGGDGCWIDGEREIIKCADCNTIFKSGADLSKNVIYRKDKEFRSALQGLLDELKEAAKDPRQIHRAVAYEVAIERIKHWLGAVLEMNK